MLKIEHLTKTYGEKKAVDDLSLHIAPGEIYGFIGHNGAGKTTTLKSVGGHTAASTRAKSPSAARPSRTIPSSARKSWPTYRTILTCTNS